MMKNQGQSEYFPPEEIFEAFHWASLDLFNEKFGEYEKTQQLTDAMTPFKKNATKTKNANLFDYPDEYFHITNLSAITKNSEGVILTEYPISIRTDGEWLISKNSKLLAPTAEDAIARLDAEGIEVAPSTVDEIKIYYVKEPVEAKYAYDNQDGEIIFKEQGSVDPEWRKPEITQLIKKTLQYFGIVIKDQELVNIDKIISE